MFGQLINPYTREHEEFGNLVNSAHRWQCTKGDDKHSILCQALDKGDIRKAVENIKGQHTGRRMIIIDESNTTSEAILAAIPNARKGCKQFIVLAIGNAFSKMDFHGRFCTPKGGWSKIDASFEKWPTVGIKEHQIEPGWCIHADGETSPNVLAKKTIYPYLYAYEDHLHGLEYKGSNEIAYWQYNRGFWANDDLKKTVMTESLLEKYDAFGSFLFIGPVKMISSADTSFSTGGDDPIQVFFKFGMLETGVKGVQLIERVKLKILDKCKDPVEYQLADQMQKNCVERGVEPQFFGLDATAIGQGVASIMQKQWSDSIHLIYFNMEASTLRASAEDPRPSNEVYFNRRTELWWSAREALTGGVFKGIYLDAAIQFCGQEYEMKGRKYFVKPKEETKKRIGRSPDDADAIVIGIDVARQHGLVGGALPGRRGDSDSLLDFARQQHEEYNDEHMYLGEQVEELEA